MTVRSDQIHRVVFNAGVVGSIGPCEDVRRKAEATACRCESLLNLAVYMHLPIQ